MIQYIVLSFIQNTTFLENGFWLHLKVEGTHERFEVLIAVTMKNAVFGDVTPWGSCTN
jgi:hypothetical protein